MNFYLFMYNSCYSGSMEAGNLIVLISLGTKPVSGDT